MNESSDLLVLRDDRSTGNASESDLPSVAFERSIDESGSHTVDVAFGFCVRESLIGGRLLETGYVLDVSSSTSGSSCSEQSENRIRNSIRIVALQRSTHSDEELLVRVLL